MYFMDIRYLMWIAPAMLLAFIAQMWIKSAYARAAQIRAGMTGAQAARAILDANGMQNVPIEEGLRETILWYKNEGWL